MCVVVGVVVDVVGVLVGGVRSRLLLLLVGYAFVVVGNGAIMFVAIDVCANLRVAVVARGAIVEDGVCGGASVLQWRCYVWHGCFCMLCHQFAAVEVATRNAPSRVRSAVAHYMPASVSRESWSKLD